MLDLAVAAASEIVRLLMPALGRFDPVGMLTGGAPDSLGRRRAGWNSPVLLRRLAGGAGRLVAGPASIGNGGNMNLNPAVGKFAADARRQG